MGILGSGIEIEIEIEIEIDEVASRRKEGSSRIKPYAFCLLPDILKTKRKVNCSMRPKTRTEYVKSAERENLRKDDSDQRFSSGRL
ncbi:hypothetical protein TWF506_001524 [Arthrobotrys conoides]|uniref:Uncharacterized protein n=1 Tax=Arthrobotrys conoides TaxID=74498 RepID=A0AAN8P9Y2_9PEZI